MTVGLSALARTLRLAAMAAAATLLSSCALQSAEPAHPDFTGVWSGVLTTQSNPFWQLPDDLCFPGCPAVLYKHVATALQDAANNPPAVEKLLPPAVAAMIAERTALSTPAGLALIEATEKPGSVELSAYCHPYGFVREALNSLPLAIRKEKDRLVIQYEEFNLKRDIWMDGRSHPAGLKPTPLGHSIGRYEDGALVIDTVAIAADQLTGLQSVNIWWGGFADGTSAVERYRIEENPRRLIVELALTDPVTLKGPYVWTKTWLFTPDVELLQDSCEEVPGQL